MTDLQLALLVLAAALLLALFGYSKWQERRVLRQLRDTLREGVGDALFDAPGTPADGAGRINERPQRVEPRMTRAVDDVPPDASPAPRPATLPQRVEPVRPASAPGGPDAGGVPASAARGARGAAPWPAGGGRDAAPAVPAVAASDWVEDPLLDFVVELRCAHAVDGVTVYDAATRLSPGLLPTAVHLVVWDARAQQWVRPDRFGFYSDLLVATQLANRRHVLTEIELSRFVAAAQQVAMALDADFDPPDVARVAAQAEELDRLCSRFDVRIGLTLESSTGPWDLARIGAAAAAAGLVAGDPNSWLRRDAAGRRVFTLGGSSLLSDRLMLELDVPTAPADTEPLRQMFAAGTQLAERLAARLVDDNGRPIDAASLAAIEAQLARLYAEMRSAGIEPAGPRALRLYA